LDSPIPHFGYKYILVVKCDIRTDFPKSGHILYVTGFWKISLNATFYNSNIYNQNGEQELPINLKVVRMCSFHFELPENNLKYFKKFCNPFVVVTINCVVLCISM